MHTEAYDGFAGKFCASGLDWHGKWRGLDVGGRNVNGSVRGLLPEATWVGLDIRPGPDVDIVADAATWEPTQLFDIVISTELFEHAREWRAIIRTMWSALDPTGPGVFISTCASIGRGAHGASGEHAPPPDEWYGNVDPNDLHDELARYFEHVDVSYNPNPGDAYALASGPRREAVE